MRMQFNIRLLFTLVMVIGVGLGFITNRYLLVANQNRRLVLLEESGAKYFCFDNDSTSFGDDSSYFLPFKYEIVKQVWGPLDSNIDLEFVKNASQIPELEYLCIGNPSVNDHHLQIILDQDPEALQRLSLSGSRITDDGLINLASIRTLTYLDVSFCRYITDDAIQRFKNLRPSVKIER